MNCFLLIVRMNKSIQRENKRRSRSTPFGNINGTDLMMKMLSLIAFGLSRTEESVERQILMRDKVVISMFNIRCQLKCK